MSSPKVALEKAIKIAGSKSALARSIGITPWALSKWNFDRIPEERCLSIEELTNQQVKAEHLRPDINWAFVRSTKNSNKAPIE
ncbi:MULTISPECIES: transcriptional regulator [Acinetobacter]|jgi:DNA-binding transcriptional regulator YdaS (Cro superfamily)|uniref:transcriptional regulator n=1 Tax=Acinetobacter TaxID=469 RepID=UPI000DEAF99F|nr:Cro/CI family transcriptional regulator [Acinetobacter haemolyticus]MDR7015041.1 DNA-binding transcriptional regulator YdaS (Cro superfamily) [Prolinoborus sp. 3657]WHR59467.1 Cro/CI family transcriptional regulator [Acinetobacter haemolyticus]